MKSGAVGFAHSLPSVKSYDVPYYLTLHEQLSDEVRSRDLEVNVSATLLERAAEMSPLRGYGEAEIVAAHIEWVSKELYAFVARYPYPMPWKPSSAYQLLCTLRDAAVADLNGETPMVLQPTKTFAGPQVACYRVHDELARVAEQPARRFIKPETWEYRQATMREFLTPPRMLAAQAVIESLCVHDAEQRTNKERSHADYSDLRCVHGFQQLAEDRRTFIHFGDGLMLHVWRVPSEARRLVSCAQKIWQTLFEYSLHPYGTLVTALLFVKGVAVTFTQLPPLLPVADCLPTDHDAHNCVSSAVAKCLAALIGSSYYTRKSGSAPPADASLAQLPNTRLHVGADGRYYFMYPMALGIYPEEVGRTPRPQRQGGSALQTPLRPEWYHCILPKGTSCRYTYDELMSNIRDGPCAAAAEAILRGALPKLTDMVTQQLVSTTMHSLGVNMRFLYLVYAHLYTKVQSGTSGELGAVALDAVTAEMLCRTVKTLLRAELSAAMNRSNSRLVSSQPETPRPLQSGEEVDDIAAQRINRFMEWLSSGDRAIWSDQLLVVLRRKFVGCPEDFFVMFHSKFFKIFMWYLTPKLGATYDAKTNAYAKVTQASSPNSSFFFVPEIVKMHLSLKQSDEAAQILATWWHAVEQLPQSTPTAWMERCLRMQRVAYICTIMKHTARKEFLAECQASILDGSRSRYRLHHAITALFQLTLTEGVDADELVDHPLYKVVVQVVREMLGARGDQELFAHQKPPTTSDLIRSSSSVGSVVVMNVQNAHFVGYVLRSLVSSVPTDSVRPSLLPSELQHHNRVAAVLQLRGNIGHLTMENARVPCAHGHGHEAADGDPPTTVALVDVGCNRQLLSDLSGTDDVFVRCAIVACLARYAVPPIGTLDLGGCTPPPTYVSQYIRNYRALLEDKALYASESARRVAHHLSWLLLSAVGRSPLWTETGMREVGLGECSFRVHVPAGQLFDSPQTICAVMFCLSTALRMWTSPSDDGTRPPSVDMTNHIRVILEANDLLTAALPAPNPAIGTIEGTFQSGEAAQDIQAAIRPAPFSSALAVVLDDVLIERGMWPLAKLVGLFLQHNSSIVKRPCVNTALEGLQRREDRATTIQKLFRRATGRGLYGDGAPVGSPDWHAALQHRMTQVVRNAFTYAAGIDILSQLLYGKIRVQAVYEASEIARWSLLLDEEVQRKGITQAREALESETHLRSLEDSEWRERFDVELEAFEVLATWTMERVSVEEFATRHFLEAAGATALGLAGILAAEMSIRLTTEVDEADAWLLDISYAFYSEMYVETLGAVVRDASAAGAVVSLIANEESARMAVSYEAIEAAVDHLLFGLWAEVALSALGDVARCGAASTQLTHIQVQESNARHSLEHLLSVECTASACTDWLWDSLAPALYRRWLSVSFLEGDALMCQLIAPLFEALSLEFLTTAGNVHHQAQSLLHGMALSTVVEENEPSDRCSIVEEYASACIGFFFMLEDLHRQNVSHSEQTLRREAASNLFLSQEVFVAEYDQRCQLILSEQEQYREHVFVKGVLGAVCVAEVTWVKSAERLYRSMHQQAFHVKQRELLFTLFENQSGRYIPIGVCGVVQREQLMRAEMLTNFAYQHKRVVAAQECAHTVRSMLVDADASWRDSLEMEVAREGARLRNAICHQLAQTRTDSLLAMEASRRSVIDRTWAADTAVCLQHVSAEHAEIAFRDQAQAAGAFIIHQERLHRSVVSTQRIQFLRDSILVRCAHDNRLRIEQLFNGERSQWAKQFVAMRNALVGGEKVVKAEMEEWDALVQLEALMRGLELNQVQTKPKALLRPSDRALHAMQKQQARRKKHQQQQVSDAALQAQLSVAATSDATLRSPSSVGAAKEYVSQPSAQPDPQDVLAQRIRSVIAAELIQRETIELVEKQLRGIAAADERELLDFFQDPAFLYYRWWVPHLPCTFALVVEEAFRTLSTSPEHAASRLGLLAAVQKKTVLQLRQMIQQLVSTKTSYARQERTAFQLLRQKEILDRDDASKNSNVSKGGIQSPAIDAFLSYRTKPSRVKGQLPGPPRGALWRDKQGAAASAAFGVAASLDFGQISSSQFGGLHAASSLLARSDRLAPHGSMAVSVKKEEELLVEDWDIRSYKALFMLANLDDLGPMEQRLRMRLEEIESICLLDCIREAPKDVAGGLLRSPTGLETSTVSLATSPIPAKGSWATHGSGSEDRNGAALVRKSAPSGPLNPVDPKGRRRQLS